MTEKLNNPIPTIEILEACYKFHSNRSILDPLEILVSKGHNEKKAFRAMERELKRGYINYGVSLRTAWLTESGEEVMKSLSND